MPKLTPTALSQRIVDTLLPGAKEHFVWDRDVRGFGVRVKPSGSATYVVQYRNADGQTRRVALKATNVMTLKDARAQAKQVLGDAAKGGDPSATRQVERHADTIKDLGDYFFDVYAKGKKLSRRHLKDCKGILNGVILPNFGTMKAKSLTRENVRRLMAKMEPTPIRANRCLAMMSKLMSLAIEKNIRVDNPCKGIAKYPENKRTDFIQMPDLTNLIRVLDVQEDKDQADAVRLLILTGARIGELLNAQWAEFDLDAGRWSKPAGHTKQRRTHRVALNDQAFVVVKSLHGRRNLASPYLFPSPDNPAVPRESFRKFWLRVRRDAGLGEVRLYDCRHTFASILLVQGVSLPVIGGLMGHSNASTTMRYAHLSDEAGRAASNKLGDLLASIPEINATTKGGV